jgi:hypothetical protein
MKVRDNREAVIGKDYVATRDLDWMDVYPVVNDQSIVVAVVDADSDYSNLIPLEYKCGYFREMTEDEAAQYGPDAYKYRA